MPPSESVLSIQNLTKSFRRTTAVDDVSFAVEPGEFVGLIGPNGAGKSTTMNCVAGTVAPDDGEVTIAGVDVTAEPVQARRNLGYVPQHLSLLDYLTGREYLDFIADLRELQDGRDAEIERLLELTELQDQRDVIIREYSGGMLRKLALIAALVGAPELLVLDESFVGLDPESTHRLRRRLAEHCDAGGAIVLSSHILEMLESLCDRFLILHEGRLARDVTAARLQQMREDGEVADLTELYLQTTGKAEQLEG